MTSDATATTAATDLLLSLPPMESQDWKIAQGRMSQLLLEPHRAAASSEECTAEEAAEKRAQAQCTAADIREPTESQFRHISERLRDYQSKRYATTAARCSLVVVRHEEEDNNATKNSACTIRTYCEHVDRSNCLAGALAGEWHVTITSEKTADCRATLRWHAHYAEDCNVQTRSAREYAAAEVSTVEEKVNAMVKRFEQEQMSYEEQLARAVVQHMERWEEDFYQALATHLADAPDLVRPLRRILPITKTRFKWDSAAQKNVQLLNARKKV